MGAFVIKTRSVQLVGVLLGELGVPFTWEKHAEGPDHISVPLSDNAGMVVEFYPATLTCTEEEARSAKKWLAEVCQVYDNFSGAGLRCEPETDNEWSVELLFTSLVPDNLPTRVGKVPVRATAVSTASAL